jgi:hypothetical protein
MDIPADIRSGWSRRDVGVACTLFLLALGFHFWGATRGWGQTYLVGNLPADEFRQTQTAISALFIQRDHDFSLAYPTPILGHPWSVPLEFPLYQWAVVGLSNATQLPLVPAGRAVSLGCFYLGLPALFLLLAQAGLSPSRRLLVLAFVLSCPLYIFYAQAFLIETMAWMLGLWFLLGFVRAVERRSGAWWLLAAVAGTGAALVKITTFGFMLIPAGALVTFHFWRERPSQLCGSWREWRTLAIQAGAALILPCLAAWWWQHFTDAVKAKSVAGNFLNSWHQRGYLFGIGVRFSRDYWTQHLSILLEYIASLPVLGIALVAFLATRRRWPLVAVLVVSFFAVQEMLPILYAWHAYYFVANTAALMVAIGLAAVALLDSSWPRPATWIVVASLLAMQGWSFYRVHYPILTQPPGRAQDLARVLHHITQRDDVLVVVGADWASHIPYYSQRRALMIPTDKQADLTFVGKAFAAQAGMPVAVLMLQGDQISNQPLIDLAMKQFHFDPRPVFKSVDRIIYLTPERRIQAMAAFDSVFTEPWIELAPESQLNPVRYNDREILWGQLPVRLREYFRAMTPRPSKIYALNGLSLFNFEGRKLFGGSAPTKLWFKAEAGSRTISAECAILPEAYTEKIPAGDRTDGVEFALSVVGADGSSRELAKLYLNPAQVPADRGLHRLKYTGEIAPGSDLLLESRPGPHGSYARDWALFGTVTVK